MQCPCNALLAVCWSKVRKVSCGTSFYLDHVLDDSLFKNLRLSRYLDVPHLLEHVSLDSYPCDIREGYQHDGEAIIGARIILYHFLATGRSAALIISLVQ